MVSTDYVHWSDRMRARGSENGFIYGENGFPIYLDGNLYRMLFAGKDGLVHRASSADGQNWTGVIDAWQDAARFRTVLHNPPGDVHNAPQYVRMPDGSEYLYFSLYQPTPNEPIFQIARARLRPLLQIQATARIEPVMPRTLDDLNCVVSVTDPTETSHLSATYQWYRDGHELVQPVEIDDRLFTVTGPALSHELTTRGETYFCYARVSDGTSYVVYRTNTVTVANSTPTAPLVKIVPANPQPTDGLGVEIEEYSFDADGDAISYEIRWYRSSDGGNTFVYRVEVSGEEPQGS